MNATEKLLREFERMIDEAATRMTPAQLRKAEREVDRIVARVKARQLKRGRQSAHAVRGDLADAAAALSRRRP